MKRTLIAAAALLSLLSGSETFAQTTGNARSSTKVTISDVLSLLAQNTRTVGSAPVGHRQPHTSDVPSETPTDLEHIGAEDAALDQKIVICRRC
jgi:hypothetical protein